MKLLLFVALSISCLNSYGQILEGGTYQFFTCKGRTERYNYYGGTTNPNTIYCPVTWTIEGGVIGTGGTQTVLQTYTNSSTGISTVDVTWTTDAQFGRLTVTTPSCSNGGSTVQINFPVNTITLTATPAILDIAAQTTLAAASNGTTNSFTWSSTPGGNLNSTTGSSVTANPTLSTTFTCTVNYTRTREVNFTVVKTITCNQNKSILVNVRPNISNNTISATGNSFFYGSGDPSLLTGSLPTGGNGFYTYKWQSSTTSATTGFSDIPSATNQNYDPPVINQTTFYRRIVTSSSYSNTSNAVSITIRPIGSNFDNPINLGNLDFCSQTGDNRSPIGYGDEYGNSYEDIFYKFNVVRAAKVRVYNCKQDGSQSPFYLLGANGSAIQGTEIESCDVGVQRDYDLQAGTYYIVTEVQDSYTVTANFDLYVFPIVSISGNTTIAQGSSTTLTASGADSYTWGTWGAASSLSSTTGSSVIVTPSVTTTYFVSSCGDYKYITVTVTGAVGSTITNPIIANIGGCGYNSPSLYINGYGNEYGGSQNDIFFRFELSSVSEVSFSGYSPNGFNLTLLNSVGAFVAAKQYGWVWVDPGGDESGYSVIGELDGIPFRPMLQPGVYFLVAEAPANNVIYVSIDTPSGYSCRKETNQFPVKRKADAESNDNLAGTISYPNPASQYLSFKLDQDAKATVYFINSNGVVLKSTSIFRNAERSDISDLPNGLYLVKIVQGDTIKYEKIVVER